MLKEIVAILTSALFVMFCITSSKFFFYLTMEWFTNYRITKKYSGITASAEDIDKYMLLAYLNTGNNEGASKEMTIFLGFIHQLSKLLKYRKKRDAIVDDVYLIGIIWAFSLILFSLVA